MGLLYVLLTMVVAVVIAAGILLVVEVIHFDASNSEYPPGLEQPAKLRIIHAILVCLSVLGAILENLHVCSKISFIRYVQNTSNKRKYSSLIIKDVKFKHVPVRIYQPKAPSAGRRRGIVYFHGGGWMFGGIGSHENICCYFSRESESVVVSVDYRRAPEHKYPDHLNDCLAATTHFLEAADEYGVDGARVIVAGDGCGGNMATAVCQTLVSRLDLPKLRGQILLYPSLQAIDFNLPSYQQNQAVPLLFREQSAFFFLQCLNAETSLIKEVLKGSHLPDGQKVQYRKWLSADNIPKAFKARGYKPRVMLSCVDEVYEAVKPLGLPDLSPLLAEDEIIRQLPETCLVTCEHDILRDDGLLYKKRLEDNGVPVTWLHLVNGFHGVISFFDKGWLSFPSGQKGINNTVRFIKSL